MASDRCSKSWSIAVSVYGDEPVMEANFSKSPALQDAADVFVQRKFPTVVAAYNDAIERCETDVLVFAHPDVYLPRHWSDQFEAALSWLDKHDPNWAVLGLFGCDQSGAGVGFTYSVGLGKFVGTPFESPQPARTVDEFVFVLRRSSGIRFDERLPGPQSQLCAPDICLQAIQGGRGVHVIPAFAMHNSNGWSVLPFGFWKPYLYMRRKWKAELPIRVPYATITRWASPMLKNTARAWIKHRKSGHRTNSRVADVESHYSQLTASLQGAFPAAQGGSKAALSDTVATN